ncbi:hypothetical protein GGH96_000955, partial [Coemansia sp. RSA 1972]
MSTCNDRHTFKSITRENSSMHTIGGNSIGVNGRGSASLDGQFTFKGILHAPQSNLNLLSVSCSAKHNIQLLFDAHGAYGYQDNNTILYAPIQDSLYPIMSNSLKNARLADAPTIYRSNTDYERNDDYNSYSDDGYDSDGNNYSGNGNSNSTLEQDKCKAVGANLTLIAKAATIQSMSIEHLHRLLGHAPKAFATEAGIRVTGNMPTACDVCTRAKLIAKPFISKLAGNARQPLAVIHSDVG